MKVRLRSQLRLKAAALSVEFHNVDGGHHVAVAALRFYLI